VSDASTLTVDYTFRFHDGRVTSVQNAVGEIADGKVTAAEAIPSGLAPLR
jgi:hypothetical protein